MPSQTTHGYPYPLGTDRVMDGDDVLHSLALAIDGQLGAAASGALAIPIATAGVSASVSVTFPVGRFTAIPNVQIGVVGNAPQTQQVAVANVTATGFVAWGNRPGGTANVNTIWQAFQQ